MTRDSAETLERLVIGICTRGRADGLLRLVESIAAQDGLLAPTPTVLIIDNNDRPTVSRDQIQSKIGVPVEIEHVSHAGLSNARNALLDKAETLCADWVCMLDDDEWVAADWFVQMIKGIAGAQCDILVGPTIFSYGDDASQFLPPRAFPQLSEGKRPVVFATGNCAMSARVFDRRRGVGMRFDPDFNRSGGEDTEFMLRAEREHAITIHGWPFALAYEKYEGERATLAYQLKRAMRSQTLIYRIARLHERLGLLNPSKPLWLRIALQTNRHAVLGLGLLLRGTLAACVSREPGYALIGKGLHRLAQAVAVVPYTVGLVPLDYGKSEGPSVQTPGE